jgi:hypothetical protein
MFMLSFFEILIGVRKRINLFRSWFFWQIEGHKKYELSSWNFIYHPKDQGGLWWRF